MLLTLLKNQITGIINLSIPLLVIAYFYPWLFGNCYSILAISLAMGFYVLYLNYKMARNQVKGLLYKPSGQIKEKIEKIIIDCGLDPASFELRYAFSHEMIGSATFNTIVIDPLVWSIIEEDPEAIKVKQILEAQLVPGFSELQKKRYAAIKEVFSPYAQQFIFKHELAHVAHNFSRKKLVIVGCIGALTALTGICTAHLLLPLIGGFAIIVALVAAGLFDILMSYLSNIVFKVRAEYNADIFAAQASTIQEIEAAAEFFEKHYSILRENQEQTILAKLPSEILSGHPNAKNRVSYLRNLAYNKSYHNHQG